MFSLKELVAQTAARKDQAEELHESLSGMFQQVAERPLGGLSSVTVVHCREMAGGFAGSTQY